MHQDLESILSDTERNLSLIKTRLAFSPKRNKDLGGKFYSPQSRVTTCNSVLLDGSQSANSLKPSTTSMLIVSLQKRVDKQSKTISHMQDAMRLQSEEHAFLQQAIKNLERRQKEPSNSGLLTMFEHFREQVQSELQVLHKLALRQKERTSTIRDLDTCQPSPLKSELEQMRRDFKSTLMRIERLEKKVKDANNEINTATIKLDKLQKRIVRDDGTTSTENKRIISKRLKDLEDVVLDLSDHVKTENFCDHFRLGAVGASADLISKPKDVFKLKGKGEKLLLTDLGDSQSEMSRSNGLSKLKTNNLLDFEVASKLSVAGDELTSIQAVDVRSLSDSCTFLDEVTCEDSDSFSSLHASVRPIEEKADDQLSLEFPVNFDDDVTINSEFENSSPKCGLESPDEVFINSKGADLLSIDEDCLFSDYQ